MNWRKDYGITTATIYKLKFAYFPIRLSDNTLIWMSCYYAGTTVFYYNDSKFKTEKGNSMSNVDYLINSLSGNIDEAGVQHHEK